MQADIQLKIKRIFTKQKDNFNYNWKDEFKSEPQVVVKRIENELQGLGPLTPLIENAAISEVLVNAYDEIFYEQGGHLQRWDESFYSEQTYHAALERLSQSCGTYLNREKPFIEAQFENIRVTQVFGEIARGKTLLSLRKQPQSRWTLQKMLHSQFINSAQLHLTENILQQNKNFLVVGGTGSGKTSFLQALLESFSVNERAIIIEDTRELQLPNLASTSLLTRQDPSQSVGDITMDDLLKRALRLRPDRLIVGEIRGAEAKSLLMALASGHSGSFGSLHARTAQEALLKLEMLVQMGAPQWSLHSVRRLMAMTLDYIFVIEKAEGRRQLKEICKINSLEETGFTFSTEC